jgi:hypothetical protein
VADPEHIKKVAGRLGLMELDTARRRIIARTLRRNLRPEQLAEIRRVFLARARRNGSKKKPPRYLVDEAIYATLRGYRVQPMFAETDPKADED